MDDRRDTPPTPGSTWDDGSELARGAAARGIHALPIPTPFLVGAVNAYLIDDDPLTLVDAGPNMATSLEELEAALARHGRRVEDIGLLVLTHQHMDHFGLGAIVARRSGADVAALDVLAPWLERFGAFQEADDAFATAVMQRNGIPADTRVALRTVSGAYRHLGLPVTVTRPLADGDRLELRDRTLHVHHRPGHSPSDIVLHDPGARTLLAGDHLIQHISSNPLIARPLTAALDDAETAAATARPQSLRIYLDSMARTEAMDDIDLVLPGHGQAFAGHAELVRERRRMHERRARKIHRMIARSPQTAFEIAQSMWGNVAVSQAYLTLSEVLGHVDLLLNDGLVAEAQDADGVVRFESLVAPA